MIATKMKRVLPCAVAQRYKELEKENSKLKQLAAELSLKKQILKEVADEGNF